VEFLTPFFDPFWERPEGRGVSAHPLTGADFYPPGGGGSAHPSANTIAKPGHKALKRTHADHSSRSPHSPLLDN